MKKVLLAFMLCVCLALPLAGCNNASLPGNAVTMQIAAYTNGVAQSFAIPANAEFYRENGASEETISTYMTNLTSAVRTRVWQQMFLNYFTIYAQNPQEEFALNGDLVTVREPEYNSVTDSVNFSFIFRSYSAWKFYHPSSSDSEQQPSEDESIFVQVDVSEGVFPFGQLSDDQPVGNIYATIIKDVKLAHFSEELVETEGNPNFVYDYATTHKRVHSNADITFSDSLYHHCWWSSYDQLSNEKTIELYTVNAVRGWWYLIALAAALVVAGVGCLTIFLVQKNQKTRKKTDDEKKKG